MKAVKRVLAIIVSVVLFAGMFSIVAKTAKAASRVDSGTFGDNMTWVLDSEGTLTISGSGAMLDFYTSYGTPWTSYLSAIKKVIIESGVTSIGGRAFSCCSNLESISIPDGVTSVGDEAFRYCESLKSVSFPDSVTIIPQH